MTVMKTSVFAAMIPFGTMATAIAAASPGADISIHQEVDFDASPERIYQALLDEKQFSAVTGAAARIDRKAGGAFRLFQAPPGFMVVGRIVELAPDERIVQAWRTESWPSGVYSIVKFELHSQGSGTRLVFDQVGFPPKDRKTLEDNWSKKYWEPLRRYLDRGNRAREG